ncbi:MAG: MFS transporter [Planctomycetes bacterium]|nr:MFS transporter [Planctomycetota bacterium]
MDRRTINGWCFYDFGNSAFAVVFPVIFGTFYAEHVVGGTAGDRWWGYVGSLSMLLVALSAPFVGGIADHAGIRKRMLLFYTLAGIATVVGFSGVGKGALHLGFALGVLANFAFEGAIVFYNAYLPDIAPASHQGRVSARGFAFGYVGSFLALGIAGVLLSKKLDFGVEAVWIACAVQWGLAGAFALSRLPKDQPSSMGLPAAASLGFRRTFDTMRDVLKRKNLRRFLLAYFIYEDGVNTVIFFAPVYAKKDFGFEAGELLLMYACLNVAAVVGSVLIGKPTDTKGPRWAVRALLVWWVFVVIAAYLAPSKPFLWTAAMLAGLGIGGIQSASRAFMSRLVPEGREAEFFGFYALCGKTGAIMGPFLFGTIADLADSRRLAILLVVVFYAVGYVLLSRVEPAADRGT